MNAWNILAFRKPGLSAGEFGFFLPWVAQHHTRSDARDVFSTSLLAEDRAAQSMLNKLIRSNLVDTTNQVEVLQRDPNSPLYSVKSFEELHL